LGTKSGPTVTRVNGPAVTLLWLAMSALPVRLGSSVPSTLLVSWVAPLSSGLLKLRLIVLPELWAPKKPGVDELVGRESKYRPVVAHRVLLRARPRKPPLISSSSASLRVVSAAVAVGSVWSGFPMGRGPAWGVPAHGS
jgi:hypothetical protein